LALTAALAGCAEPYRTPGDPPRSAAPRRVATLDPQGRVEVRRQGRAYAGGVGMPLYAGDEVRTFGASYARIRFVDGDRVWLDHETHVRVGSLFTFFGRVFAAVSGVFEIDTEFVTASTEGTEFAVSVGRGGRNEFSVAVRNGIVRCLPRRGNWRPIRLGAGQRLRGQGNGTPDTDRLDGRESQVEFGWVPAQRGGALDQLVPPTAPQVPPSQRPR
jgi:ferric-dicitrate binding protein FerR (iron transport regulator)